MNRLKTATGSVGLALAAITVAITGAHVTAQQPSVPLSAENNLLNATVTKFEVRDKSLIDAIWDLARGPAPFAFGFEHTLKKKITDPEVPEPHLNLELENKTVRQILEALCRSDPRFTWSMDGLTVNVYPRATIDNPSYLLNRKLPIFDLNNATDPDDGLFAIVHELPPPAEQIANAQVGGADTYPPQPWTVTFRDLTVRQVVNRLALHGGPCGIWIFGGAEDFRSFGFFNTYLPCPQ